MTLGSAFGVTIFECFGHGDDLLFMSSPLAERIKVRVLIIIMLDINRQLTLARNLRKNETDAERLLWSRLRSSQVYGLKFRRQQPVDNYIVDFVTFEKRLIIEIDGSQHTEAKDKERTDKLESKSYKILRFWNNDVLQNTEGVLEKILEELKLTPSPTLSRQGEGQKGEQPC